VAVAVCLKLIIAVYLNNGLIFSSGDRPEDAVDVYFEP